jgi:type I restriction enzyme M protein
MLVEAAQHLREQYKGEYEGEELQEFIDKEFEFTGQEKNPTIAGIAKMNLALHGLKGDIRRGDSLTSPQFATQNKLDEFDYILANFPFSQSGWKGGTEERQDNYDDMNWAENGKLPHGNYGDFAFIMHMDSHLNDTGQLATVIPHGILFRNGDKKYREYMIENDMIEAVIGLPEDLFEATGIPSGILVLNKNKPDEREGQVMFFNADHEDRFFYDTGSSRTKLLDGGISEIKEMFDSWSDEERVCRVVSNDEIRENEYNMNIALYVDTTEPQEDIDVRDTLASVRDIEHEYQQLNQQFTQYMQQLNYEDNNQGDTE